MFESADVFKFSRELVKLLCYLSTAEVSWFLDSFDYHRLTIGVVESLINEGVLALSLHFAEYIPLKWILYGLTVAI